MATKVKVGSRERANTAVRAELTAVVLQADALAAAAADAAGRLPLAVAAASGCDVDTLRLLLDANADAAGLPDAAGRVSIGWIYKWFLFVVSFPCFLALIAVAKRGKNIVKFLC